MLIRFQLQYDLNDLDNQENSLQIRCFKDRSIRVRKFSRNQFLIFIQLLRLARIVTVILTDGLVQDDSCPVSRGEFGLADISNRAWFRAANPYSVSNFKAVCVLGQDDAGIYADRRRYLLKYRLSTTLSCKHLTLKSRRKFK